MMASFSPKSSNSRNNDRQPIAGYMGSVSIDIYRRGQHTSNNAPVSDEPVISSTSNKKLPLLDYIFVDAAPKKEIPEEKVKNIWREMCCYEFLSILPSLKIIKILIHVVSLALAFSDFWTDIDVYKTLSSAEDMNNFQIAYLIFLIISFVPFVVEILTGLVGIFVAAIKNKKVSPFHQSEIRISSLILEDFPLSLIVLISLFKSGNCGYVVSLTYSKRAKWSSITAILACLWKLFWLGVNINDYDNYRNNPGSRATPITCDILVNVLFWVPYKLTNYLFKKLRNKTILDTTFHTAAFIVVIAIILAPLIVAFINIYYLMNLGQLADVSGCAFFTLNISSVILFPIAHGSNCVENEYYSMKMGISGTSEGPRLLEANKMVITSEFNRLFPLEFNSHYSITPKDNCLVFASAMYSTKDFVPEFNLAFSIKKQTSNNSICLKPFFETGDISFSAPWIQFSRTPELVGKLYCGSKNFSACLMPPIIYGNSPCFDCNRNCYSWVAFEKKPIIFQSFKGKLTVRGKEPQAMRHNVKLTTHCDVDSDWKHKHAFRV